MFKIEKFAEIIKNSKNIAVFTGAGISCASGIPDFRSDKGLYQQPSGYDYAPEEIISHSFFLKKPQIFYDFYRQKMLFPDANPNIAHLFFSELQNTKNVSIITQNIDGLHQSAGSKTVFELHGSVLRNYCMDCHASYPVEEIINSNDIPKCKKCNGVIKPDVVLYEESLDSDVIEGAVSAISHADCLIIVGTSLTVYPAASFVRYYKGNKCVLINKQKTPYDSMCDLVFNDDIVEVITELKKKL